MTLSTQIEPGAASLGAVANELIGPFSGAVQPQQLPWGSGTGFGTGEVTYRPVLLVRLLADLGEESLDVTVTVDGTPQPVLTFAPWSERGSQLLAYLPPTDTQGAAAAFAGSLTASRTTDGTITALSDTEVAETFAVDLVQGMLGRLVLAMLAEKARLRRQARELRAMRVIATARDSALDRLGGDLGVPRLADRISWDATNKQVATTPLPGGREDDADYRPRLRVWRGFRLPSPDWIDASLNGPGSAGDPGAGWLADLGFSHRVTVDEQQNPLYVAFRLVAPNIPNGRKKLLDGIRRTHLIWVAGSSIGDAAHSARMEPTATKTRIAATRAALKNLKLPAAQPVAPALAFALQRLDATQTALGVKVYSNILTGQKDDGGSRYELGLGAQLQAANPADVTSAIAAAGAKPELGLAAVPAAQDPIAAWLLTACGLRTAQRLDDGSVYVSAMSSGGLVVDLAPGPESPVPLSLSARLENGDGSTLDAPLAAVIAALTASSLTTTTPAPVLANMKASSTVAGIDTVLANQGLPRVAAAEIPDIQQRFTLIDSRDYVAVDLGPALTSDIAGDPSKLSGIVASVAAAGASSLLPVLTAAGTLALVIGIVDLPLAGNNLAAQHTVAFRWQVRSLDGHAPTLSARRGSNVQLTQHGSGIGLVTCLAYVRTGHNDPYQWRPTLPDGVLLSLQQYEHLMNIVELATPVGVQANTWTIRQRHVDATGTNTATALSPSAARTYHRYRTR